MYIDGIQVAEGSSISNLTVSSGSTFPASPSLGELFYNTGATPGLYIYFGGSWTKLADSDEVTDSIEGAVSGIDLKQSVKAATTANITLSGNQTIDGVAVVDGHRVLVKDQTDATQNGIYVVASGSWTRSADADGTPANEVSTGMYCYVETGTVNANSGWMLVTTGTITLGTSELTFAKFTGTGGITAGSGMSKSGDTLNVNTANASNIVVNADNIDLATTGIAAGTYKSVTVDAYGRATAGTNPTTLSGFGITDAVESSLVGAANGLATLDATGKVTTAQLPDITITDTFVVANQAAMLALSAQVGDVAVRTDLNKSFILKTAGASTLANWQELLSPTDAVTSVNGQTGIVALTAANVGAPSVNPASPVDGDIQVSAGPVIKIYASGAWRQVFPAQYS